MPTRQWWPRRNHSAELCWRDLTNARIHLSNGAQSSRSSCIIGMKLSLNTRLLSSLYASKCSKNRHSLLGVSILLRMIREPRGHIFPGSLSTTAPSEQKWHGPNFTIQSCKFNSELERKKCSKICSRENLLCVAALPAIVILHSYINERTLPDVNRLMFF